MKPEGCGKKVTERDWNGKRRKHVIRSRNGKVCRKRQLLLLDQMIQLGKKKCRVLGTTAKNLMWSLLETTGESDHQSIFTFQTLGSFQTFQASLASIPTGDCLGLKPGHIPICHVVHGEASLWLCGELLCADARW